MRLNANSARRKYLGRTSILYSGYDAPEAKPVNPRTPVALEQ
jgi:hypothetical protein